MYVSILRPMRPNTQACRLHTRSLGARCVINDGLYIASYRPRFLVTCRSYFPRVSPDSLLPSHTLYINPPPVFRFEKYEMFPTAQATSLYVYNPSQQRHILFSTVKSTTLPVSQIYTKLLSNYQNQNLEEDALPIHYHALRHPLSPLFYHYSLPHDGSRCWNASVQFGRQHETSLSFIGNPGRGAQCARL